MNKRVFIKNSFAGAMALLSYPVWGKIKHSISHGSKKFSLPELPYAYDALEPFIDQETMKIHHTKHHAGYTAKFNIALEKEGLKPKNIREIFKNASNHSAAVVNNAGGFFNHRIFWNFLSPEGGGSPKGDLAKKINRDFGSFENFKEIFSKAAKTQFGSGWAWLISQDGKLKVTATSDQNNPFMDTLPPEERGFPLLCIDVWEHAYYLKYQNRRSDYVDAFWNIVNWDTVSKRFANSLK